VIPLIPVGIVIAAIEIHADVGVAPCVVVADVIQAVRHRDIIDSFGGESIVHIHRPANAESLVVDLQEEIIAAYDQLRGAGAGCRDIIVPLNQPPNLCPLRCPSGCLSMIMEGAGIAREFNGGAPSGRNDIALIIDRQFNRRKDSVVERMLVRVLNSDILRTADDDVLPALSTAFANTVCEPLAD
jgi:hypothetical protein